MRRRSKSKLPSQVNVSNPTSRRVFDLTCDEQYLITQEFLHKGSKLTPEKLKVLINVWNLPKVTEVVSVKAGIRVRKHIYEKVTRIFFLTQICHKNSPSTQQETLNGFISLQSGAETVQQCCHKIALMHSIDLLVVVFLWMWVCLFASGFFMLLLTSCSWGFKSLFMRYPSI